MPKKPKPTKKNQPRSNSLLRPVSAIKKQALLGVLVLASTIGVYAVSQSQAAGIGNKVVDTAQKYVGLSETDKNGNHCENCGGMQNGKYTGAINKITGSTYRDSDSNPSKPWCAYFVSYVYKQAGDSFGKVGRADNLGAAIKKDGGYYYKATATNESKHKPQPGDAIMFNRGDGHAGIVEKITCTGKKASSCTVHTIEGNSGDKVSRHKYKLTDPDIKGWAGKNKPNSGVNNSAKPKPTAKDAPNQSGVNNSAKPKSTPKCSTAYECAGGGNGKAVNIN